MSKSKVLWVSPRWLLPINDGARQATDKLLKSTFAAHTDISLDLLIWVDRTKTTQEIESLKSKYSLNQIIVLKRFLFFLPSFLTHFIFLLLSFILMKPLTLFYFFSFQLLIKNKRGFCKQYDYIVFDAPHGALCFLPFLKKKSKLGANENQKIILRAQNLETQIWKSASDKAIENNKPLIFVKLLKSQAALMKKFESKVVGESSLVACVSQCEVRLFSKFFFTKKCIEIPISYDFTQKPNWSNQALKWGFIGKLDWPPNHDGLVWFVKEVWSKVQNSSAFPFLIAGSGQLSSELQSLMAQQNIKFLGFVESTNEFYDQIDGVVIPIFYGGGTRVKAIEASQNGKLILSTLLGVNGLSLKPENDYLRFENALECIQILKNLINHQSEIQNRPQTCFKRLSEKFDHQVVQKKWQSVLSR